MHTRQTSSSNGQIIPMPKSKKLTTLNISHDSSTSIYFPIQNNDLEFEHKKTEKISSFKNITINFCSLEETHKIISTMPYLSLYQLKEVKFFIEERINKLGGTPPKDIIKIYNIVKTVLIKLSFIMLLKNPSSNRAFIQEYKELVEILLKINSIVDQNLQNEIKNIIATLVAQNKHFGISDEDNPADNTSIKLMPSTQNKALYNYDKKYEGINNDFEYADTIDTYNNAKDINLVNLKIDTDNESYIIQDNLANVSEFDGGIALGFYNGMCHILYENGITETGKFVNGIRSGIHVFSYPNKTKFVFVSNLDPRAKITGLYTINQLKKFICFGFELHELINHSGKINGLVLFENNNEEEQGYILEQGKLLKLPTIEEIIGNQYSNPQEYPQDKDVNDSILQLIQTYNLGILPQYAYTLVIDRAFIEETTRKYSPTMFDNSANCNLPSYNEQFFRAFAEILPIKELNFEVLEHITYILLAENSNTNILSTEGRTHNPVTAARKYYKTNNIKGYGFDYDKSILLNQFCTDDTYLSRKTISVRYPSRNHIIDIYAQYLGKYQVNIKDAQTDREKITAIIFFVSQIECSHFFINGNNRLSCQLLLNKLLLENNLPICALYIPNGFSHYCLKLVNEQMIKTALYSVRVGTDEELTEAESLTRKIPSITDMAKALEPAILWVEEGQEFCQKTLRTDS